MCIRDSVCSLSPPAPNALVFDIQPNEGVHLYLWVKRPGMNMDVHQVDMSFRYDEAFPGKLPDAYERLLVDVMRGDQTLFALSLIHIWGGGNSLLQPRLLVRWSDGRVGGLER